MKAATWGLGISSAVAVFVAVAGACAPPPPQTGCAEGEAECYDPSVDDFKCIDVTTSVDNCGECGYSCNDFGAGQLCQKGKCVEPPKPPDGGPPDAPVEASPEAGDAAVPPSLDCTYYCNTVMAACTGAQAQYLSMASCLAFCAKMPTGALGDTSGNTLGCRIGHVAIAGGSPATECANAGPAGGDTTAGGSPGACGDICDSLCTVGTSVCPDETNECATMLCPTYSASPSYSTALSTGDTVGCRLFYVTRAVESAADATLYCTNVGVASDGCTNN